MLEALLFSHALVPRFSATKITLLAPPGVVAGRVMRPPGETATAAPDADKYRKLAETACAGASGAKATATAGRKTREKKVWK
jgi:hypothetical protein